MKEAMVRIYESIFIIPPFGLSTRNPVWLNPFFVWFQLPVLGEDTNIPFELRESSIIRK